MMDKNGAPKEKSVTGKSSREVGLRTNKTLEWL